PAETEPAPPVDAPGTPTASPADAPTADLPALLARLNDPLRAGGMGFHERHTAVRDVSAGGLGDQLNIPLQLYFDLAQAKQADRPCGTFRSALIALNAAHDETLLGRARTGVTVPAAPGPDEAPTACDGLPALLAGGAGEGPVPVAEPKRGGRTSKHKSKPRPKPRDTTPPPEDVAAADPPSKPKPSHDVAGKLGDDTLRPFGKR
ncbi:MAG: hypothetical protein JKY37_05270, partial [Nannocystaceae bacterium]|nr:hypothetical protein [Nannocystaceae bacterium]